MFPSHRWCTTYRQHFSRASSGTTARLDFFQGAENTMHILKTQLKSNKGGPTMTDFIDVLFPGKVCLLKIIYTVFAN